MNRRHLVRPLLAMLAALATASAPTAHASDQVVGIVSLVADQLTVTGFEATTGSKLEANPSARIELRSGELDKSMLRAAMRAVAEARAGKAVPLLITDTTVYDAQHRMLDADKVVLPAPLLGTLQEQKATWLLLLTKHRAEARMRALDGELGTGRVEGLGFYVDRVARVRISATSEQAQGYIAPHVYVRMSLIDLATSRVLRSRVVTASRVYAAGSGDRGADPWELLDGQAKLKALNELIDKECGPAMRALLST